MDALAFFYEADETYVQVFSAIMRYLAPLLMFLLLLRSIRPLITFLPAELAMMEMPKRARAK